MATNTYVALDKVTVGTATPSITFTGISGAYTDLVVVASAKSSLTTTTQVQLTFNSDSTTNYSWTRLLGDGSAASSARGTSQAYVEVGFIAGNTGSPSPDLFTLNIQNYSNATTHKTFSSRWGSMNAANQYVAGVIGLWRKTPEAITSLTLTATAANFAVGSTFSLYGIKAWADETTPKATGGYVYSDSTYWYHAFLFSSTFTPNQSLSCDTLVVAGGGGGGGANAGAGGGAGGLVYRTGISASATPYTVVVGAGGTGQIPSSGGGSNGGNSSVFSLTGTGGGSGGYWQTTSTRNGASGGSGGGGGEFAGPGTVGSSTQDAYSGDGFGNAGGLPFVSGGDIRTGGGGGAGAVGGAGVSGGNAGSGGNGKFYDDFGSVTGTGQYINSHYYYAGGGGGSQYANGILNGVGGYGGGGAGGTGAVNNAVAGTANTGGGGGGSGYQAAGDTVRVNGGSGIVIVRYLKA
jgi:hypothetical protein